jgi:hypothetical protein
MLMRFFILLPGPESAAIWAYHLRDSAAVVLGPADTLVIGVGLQVKRGKREARASLRVMLLPPRDRLPMRQR